MLWYSNDYENYKKFHKRQILLGGITLNYLEVIEETTYLSTSNTPRYRRIMRIFFIEYEKMNFQLYKEDIFEQMKEYAEFSDYTMEQLKSDLETLVTWKNIIPIQDPKRVYTIAEYKNKQFRYTMSEYSVEIERMTVKLENLYMESGNLSTNYFVRIEKELDKIEMIQQNSLKDINEWWHNLQEDFKRLNRNYQDYLREFYSSRTDKILKSVEFILHKDRFIAYLKDFVRQLQNKSTRIESRIKNISEEMVISVLEQVIESELEIPHPNQEVQNVRKTNIRENVYGRWNALKQWFISTPSHPSECSQVLDITDEIIRKIIQNAALIVQMQNWGISRKDDYKKFMDMFSNCENLEEAHQLAAHLFGIMHVRHFKVNRPRSTDSIYSSVYEEEPAEYEVKPHTRTYKPKLFKAGFENKEKEKLLQKEQYMKQLEEDKALVLTYIKDNRLDIRDLNDCITANTRNTLLRWITQANNTNSKSGRTEYGQVFHLIQKEGSHRLKCEDGELVMPVYVFEFEGE